MSTTYDPSDPAYLNAADVRQELDRVFDLCHGCRVCFSLCPSFDSLFTLIDEKTDGISVALSAADNDRIVDECYQCKLCHIKCPYVPPHEWLLDFPRLMLRARAARSRGKPAKIADRFLGATELAGRLGSLTAPVANAANRSKPVRFLMEKTVGVHRERLLPLYARERFTKWFKKEGAAKCSRPSSEKRAAFFVTCMVEYNDPSIGKAAVEVLARNGVDLTCPETVCCGMPALDGGDLKGFMERARKNVAALVPEAEAGKKILVPQPTCGYVLRQDYPDYLKTSDAETVAAAVRDVGEYLTELGRDEALDEEFPVALGKVAYHAPCHLRAQGKGLKSRDLLKKLPGTEVTLVEGCSGIDGTWGYKAKWYEMAREVAAPLADRIRKAGPDLVVDDCLLAGTAIEQETGLKPIHPLHALARAYGIRGDAAGEHLSPITPAGEGAGPGAGAGDGAAGKSDPGGA